jgi:hypothetical protein
VGRSFEADTSEREIVGLLKIALGSAVVVLFDDDLGRVHLSTEPSTEGLWAELSRAADKGEDGLYSARIHERWVLIVAAGRPLGTAAEVLISAAVDALGSLLPADRVKDSATGSSGPGSGGSAAPAEMGIPVWWVRKDRG